LVMMFVQVGVAGALSLAAVARLARSQIANVEMDCMVDISAVCRAGCCCQCCWERSCGRRGEARA
jgi:hypothetical protein